MNQTRSDNSIEALQLISQAWSNSTLPLVATAEALLRGEEVALPSIEERYIEGIEVGRGGLGRILSAYDKHLGRQVALKEKLRDSPIAQARFFQEAIITAQLEHPSIIPIYDFGRRKGGEICYTMKLVSGKTLQELISQNPLYGTRLPLLRHVLAICEAVAYAHAKKIIHRDLKPQNILIGEFGETMLIDWGLAKELGAGGPTFIAPNTTSRQSTEPGNGLVPHTRRIEQSGVKNRREEEQGFDVQSAPVDLTEHGAILGTPAYMPPEQARGQEVNERADVYSLGAILYQVISGKPPYPQKNSKDLLRARLSGSPTPLKQITPLANQDLISITEKAMSEDPQERYATAKELAQDLKSFLAGQMVAARQYSSTEKLYRFFQKYRLSVFLWAALLIGMMSVSAFIYSLVSMSAELQECRRIK